MTRQPVVEARKGSVSRICLLALVVSLLCNERTARRVEIETCSTYQLVDLSAAAEKPSDVVIGAGVSRHTCRAATERLGPKSRVMKPVKMVDGTGLPEQIPRHCDSNAHIYRAGPACREALPFWSTAPLCPRGSQAQNHCAGQLAKGPLEKSILMPVGITGPSETGWTCHSWVSG